MVEIETSSLQSTWNLRQGHFSNKINKCDRRHVDIFSYICTWKRIGSTIFLTYF